MKLKVHQIEATSTPDSTNFLRGDGAWATPAGGGGGGSVQDRRWTVGGSETTCDEFNDASLDAAWVRVDGTGAAVGNLDWAEGADVLSAYNKGGDSINRFHALLRPLTGVGGSMAAGDAFITCCDLFAPNGNHSMAGLLLADGTTFGSGNQVWGEIARQSSDTTSLQSVALTGFNDAGTAAGAMANGITLRKVYIRLVMTATNTWRTDFSPNGVQWINGTATLSKTLTPTHIGFISSSYGTSTKHIASYEFLRRVSGVS